VRSNITIIEIDVFPPGCGKTMTFLHAFHFLHNDPQRIVLNFGDVSRWTKRYLQIAQSNYKEGRYDHIGNSHNLLRHFAEFNKGKLDGLKTSKDYKWSQR
jgi:hypothetical protein